MLNTPEASIRKNRPGRWRGYIGGVPVIQFEDSEKQSAEEAAKQWLASPKPPHSEKPRAAPATAAPSRQLIEHVKINYADVVQHGLAQNQNFLALYWEMQESFADRESG